MGYSVPLAFSIVKIMHPTSWTEPKSNWRIEPMFILSHLKLVVKSPSVRLSGNRIDPSALEAIKLDVA